MSTYGTCLLVVVLVATASLVESKSRAVTYNVSLEWEEVEEEYRPSIDSQTNRRVLAGTGSHIGYQALYADQQVCEASCSTRNQPYTRGCQKIYGCK